MKLTKSYLYRVFIRAYIDGKVQGYLRKVWKYLQDMIPLIADDFSNAYFIIGAVIALNCDSKMLKGIISKILKETGLRDENLLKVYKALKNADENIGTVIRKSTVFVKEHESIGQNKINLLI